MCQNKSPDNTRLLGYDEPSNLDAIFCLASAMEDAIEVEGPSLQPTRISGSEVLVTRTQMLFALDRNESCGCF